MVDVIKILEWERGGSICCSKDFILVFSFFQKWGLKKGMLLNNRNFRIRRICNEALIKKRKCGSIR